MTLEQMEKRYGSVTKGEIKIILTEAARCENYGTDGGVRYYADGVDANDNKYRAVWETIDNWIEDEENACDWDNPINIIKLDSE